MSTCGICRLYCFKKVYTLVACCFSLLHQLVLHDASEVSLQAYLERIKELEIDQVNKCNKKNQTPLYLAVYKNKHLLVRTLLKFGANVNTLVQVGGIAYKLLTYL